jgi:hypothetical protein
VAALAPSEAGRGVMLKDGRELLGWLPAGLDELETAALQANNDNIFVTGDAEADRCELPIGPAVRVRYVRLFAWVGPFASIDYWFFADGQRTPRPTAL